MVKYLISAVNTVRVHTVADVETLHEELKNDARFDLVEFSYKTKDIKVKREVVDQYLMRFYLLAPLKVAQVMILQQQKILIAILGKLLMYLLV